MSRTDRWISASICFSLTWVWQIDSIIRCFANLLSNASDFLVLIVEFVKNPLGTKFLLLHSKQNLRCAFSHPRFSKSLIDLLMILLQEKSVKRWVVVTVYAMRIEHIKHSKNIREQRFRISAFIKLISNSGMVLTKNKPINSVFSSAYANASY